VGLLGAPCATYHQVCTVPDRHCRQSRRQFAALRTDSTALAASMAVSRIT
jgi:hypothetical protein